MSKSELQELKVLKTYNEFADLMESDELLLFDFFAPWCAPCRELNKVLCQFQTSQAKLPKFGIYKIDIDNSEFEEVVNEFEVNSIPKLVLVKDKEVIHHNTGLRNVKEFLIDVLKSHNKLC